MTVGGQAPGECGRYAWPLGEWFGYKDKGTGSEVITAQLLY